MKEDKKSYIEDFDSGPGGWWGWRGNHLGLEALVCTDSAIQTTGPWWIDYNHAPPGAGYLHMLFCLNTKGPLGEQMQEIGGRNAFIASGCSRNLENTVVRLRIRGTVRPRGAQAVLLIQSNVDGLVAPWALTSQPVAIDSEWSEQELILEPDPAGWTCLGGRHDRTDYYGERPLACCLRDVNVNLMLVYFPLTIHPMGDPGGHPDQLRPERDYPVWRSELPEGRIQMDRFEILYP